MQYRVEHSKGKSALLLPVTPYVKIKKTKVTVALRDSDGLCTRGEYTDWSH